MAHTALNYTLTHLYTFHATPIALHTALHTTHCTTHCTLYYQLHTVLYTAHRTTHCTLHTPLLLGKAGHGWEPSSGLHCAPSCPKWFCPTLQRISTKKSVGHSHSTDQCSASKCSAVQCSAVQCSSVQCSAVQCSAVRCIVVQRNTMHYSAALCLR